jgi:hypothetical protein
MRSHEDGARCVETPLADDHFAGSGYTPHAMAVSSSEALIQLDALRERLKDAAVRLGWLRSYL